MQFQSDRSGLADRSLCTSFRLLSGMELALDLGDQDLLDFLLEESGDLGAGPPLSEVGGGCEPGRRGDPGRAFMGWWVVDRSRLVYLNPVQALSEWEAEDFLSSMLSPPASLNVLSSSDSCLVHHDHTYSLSQQHVSIDLGESEI